MVPEGLAEPEAAAAERADPSAVPALQVALHVAVAEPVPPVAEAAQPVAALSVAAAAEPAVPEPEPEPERSPPALVRSR